MESSYDFLIALGLDEQADERAIRRAYARRLKQIDQAADAAGFQALRDAYETAMSWAAYRQREALHAQHAAQADAQPSAQSDAEPTDPAQVTAPPEPAVAAEETPPASLQTETLAPAEEAPPAMRPAEQALETVWERYQADVGELAAAHRLADEAAWKTILRARLADDELINIDARMQFEWRIVYILGNGWRPGHEALFPAATEVFGWADERRALAQFGYYGKLLNQAIDEHALFQAQEITYRSVQQRIAMLLRREKPAETVEILHSAREMELMHERFPALMLVVTNPANAEHWRTVHAENHVDEMPPKPGVMKRLARWCVYACLVVVAFLVLRFIYQFDDWTRHGTPPTAELLRKHVPVIAYQPPPDARPGTYTVKYRVFLDSDGSVRAVHLLKFSGDKELDKAVTWALRDATPFPPDTATVFEGSYTTKVGSDQALQPREHATPMDTMLPATGEPAQPPR